VPRFNGFLKRASRKPRDIGTNCGGGGGGGAAYTENQCCQIPFLATSLFLKGTKESDLPQL